MDLSGKVIILTGATGGIGKAIATELSKAGSQLILTGRNQEKLESLASSLESGNYQLLVADLTTNEGINRLAAIAAKTKPDGLINCLGINQLKTLEASTQLDATDLITTNLLAPINTCRNLVPLLKIKNSAIIVNVGSILGSIGYPGSSLYCASKFGLRGFTESLRRELADTNIKVIYFAPRATDTLLNTEQMNQMNQELGNHVDNPNAVAKQLIQALESGRSGSRYIGWPEALFVRINSLFPALVDSALAKKLSTIKRYCQLGQAC